MIEKLLRPFAWIYHFFYDLVITFYYRKLKKIGVLFVILIWISTICIVAVLSLEPFYFSDKKLEYIKEQMFKTPPVTSTVYDDQGNKVVEFSKENRQLVSFNEIPEILLSAFIAAEDKQFFKHDGIDFIGTVRALNKDIKSMSFKQGGSTITQQLVRNISDLSREKTLDRKFQEVIFSFAIEGTLSKEKDKEKKRERKEEIIEKYLNIAYLGRGAYGVVAAAENYFNKTLNELKINEAAFIAGLVQAPSRYDNNFDAAKERMRYVLKQMKNNSMITEDELGQALSEDIILAEKPIWGLDYFSEHIRRLIFEKYGGEKLYTGGLQIYTTLNLETQKKAQAAFDKGLFEFDRRQGYRGASDFLDNIEDFQLFLEKAKVEAKIRPPKVGEIYNGLVAEVDKTKPQVIVIFSDKETGLITDEDVEWGLETNDFKAQDIVQIKLIEQIPDSHIWHVSLVQEPKVQAAFLDAEIETGYVKAMIGGKDFRKSEYNRAIQAKRQIGSAIKPLLYAAAFSKGYQPYSKLPDVQINYGKWTPKNYNGKFSNKEVSLSYAFAKSLNSVAVSLLNKIGNDYMIKFAKKLGVESDFKKHDLTLALGSNGMSLLETVKAYSVFADKGRLKDLVFILRIVDCKGKILEDNTKPLKKQVIEKQIAEKILGLMRGVMVFGTGRNINPANKFTLGKTGTTSENHDAWFIGFDCKPKWKTPKKENIYGDSFIDSWIPAPEPEPYISEFNPQRITGVWVGYDEYVSLGKGETGSRTAGPIWKYFIESL